MKNKLNLIFLTTLALILITTFSFASYDNVSMTVVSEPVCTINLTDNSTVEKKLISKDLANKKVALQLSVTNNETVTKPTGEIMIVIDNSNSLNTESSPTRKELIYSSAKTLISSLLTDNDALKVGIVSFSSKDVAGGSADDAILVSNLTNNASNLNSAIDGITVDGAKTNLEAGLTLGKQYFSTEENNKYMIVLTDGVPNVAINYSGNYYSDDVIAKSKAALQDVSSSNIHLITMLSGIDNPDAVATPSTKTYGEIITEVFGTENTPTAGTFYNIQDSDIETTITKTIYDSLVSTPTSLKNITVTDYFPKEIIDNFDFAYIKEANIGTISAVVDTTTNSITWTIPELKPNETAIVQYELKLKQNYDNSILNKILKTNTKVDVNYTDPNDKAQTKTSDVSPTLKLTEPTILPAAGTPVIITLSLVLGGIMIFSLIRYTYISKQMK